jgi:hypothetical protein
MSRRRRAKAVILDGVIPARAAPSELSRDERWLVVVRESAIKPAAFTQMVYKVMANLRHLQIPGLATAERLGVDIFHSAEARKGLDGLQELRRSGARPGSSPYGYLFRVDGTWFLFAQVSAHKTTDNQDNDFTRDLTGAVRSLRPTHLGSGPTSRLCRHRDHISMLNIALENVGGPTTRIVCDDSHGRSLDLRVTSDREIWDKSCDDAVADYVATRRRLSAGTAGVLALGEWQFCEEALPAGYKFEDPQTFVVQPDTEWRAFVAEVIEVSAKYYGAECDADPRKEWALALEAVIEVCDRHGWLSGILRRSLGPRAKFSDARYPRRNAERLWSYLELWLNGEYEMRQRLGLGLGEHQLQYNGVPLERVRDKHGNTTIYMVKLLDFGTFDWTEAERDLLGQAITLRSPSQRPRGVGGRRLGQTLTVTGVLPLLGLCEFVEGKWQYRLVRNNLESYKLIRRPTADVFYGEGQRHGWRPGEGDPVATIQCIALHEGIAMAAVRLIDQGGVAPALTRLPLPRLDVDERDAAAQYEAEVKELGGQIANLVQRASILRDQETDERIEGNAAAAKDFKDKALKADNAVESLRRQLNGLTPPHPGPSVLPAGTTADVGEVAVALAALARTESSSPPLLHEAVGRIVTGLRVTAGVSSANVSFSVRLPTSHGPVTLGPTEFRLPNSLQANKAARMAEMLTLFFVKGMSWTQIGAEVTRSPELAHGQVRKHLEAAYPQLSSGARTAIMQCPITNTRRIVWHALTGEGSVAHFPKAWVAHIRSIYLSDIPRRRAWAGDTHALRREVLAYLLSHQGDPEDGVSVLDAAKVTGHAVSRITALVDPVPSVGLDYEPSYERVDATHWGRKRVTHLARIRARMCPWCRSRTATHVLRVPECPDDLLCAECRRMPSDPSVQFPQEYLKLWVGGTPKSGAGTGTGGARTTTAMTAVEVPVAWKMRKRRVG